MIKQMLTRLLAKSLWKQKTSTALIVLSVASAAALVSAFLNLAFHLTEQVAKELRSFGANILLVPRSDPLEVEIGGLKYVAPEESAHLEEADLVKLKTIFWRHNIVAFAPFLSRLVEIEGNRALLVGTWFEQEIAIPAGKGLFTFASGIQREVEPDSGKFRTGLKSLARWWRVEGGWVGEDGQGVLLGSQLAQRIGVGRGGVVRITYQGRTVLFPIRGLVQTGGVEEEQVFVHLKKAQDLFGLPGKVDKIQVSALVTPDNSLAIRASRIGPARLSPEEYETWYCSPFLNSIIHQFEEAIPDSSAKAIRQVSEAEGAFIGKMRLTFMLTVALALLAASLGVMAAMMTAIFERRQEIGLMKALGADGKQISLFFLLEGGISGFFGGVLGYFGGLAFARLLAARTFSLASFSLPLSLQGVILFTTLILAVGLAVVGSFLPMREATRLEPIRAMRGS